MSANIQEGCACMYLGSMSPCSWCESLTHTEVSILDEHGYDVLRWLQTHYLLHNGEWDWAENNEEGGSLEEFISASLVLANTDITMKRNYKDAPSPLDQKLSTLRDIEAKMKAKPPLPLHLSRGGTLLPIAALHTAEIIDFAAYLTRKAARKDST